MKSKILILAVLLFRSSCQTTQMTPEQDRQFMESWGTLHGLNEQQRIQADNFYRAQENAVRVMEANKPVEQRKHYECHITTFGVRCY